MTAWQLGCLRVLGAKLLNADRARARLKWYDANMELRPLPELLESDRVSLKKHRLEIAEMMFQAVDDNRDRLSRFMPWAETTKSANDSADYIQKTIDKWHAREQFDFGIYLKASDSYVGNMGVHAIDWAADCCEIGYWIVGEFEGQGLISDGIRALETAVFERGFHRIEIRCTADNKRSASVPIRNGYKLEGRLRQNRVEGGVRCDTLVFGKLASEVRG